MVSRNQFKATLSRLFGFFLFVTAVGNVLIEQLSSAVLFGILGIAFLALSGAIDTSDTAAENETEVSDRLARVVVFVGWVLVLSSAAIVATLVFV